MFMKSDILITGGSGFIGGHLVSALSGKSEIFLHTRQEAKLFAKEVLCGATVLRGFFETKKIAEQIGKTVGTVFHLAGAISVKDGLDLFNANVVTTANVIDLMVRNSIPHLVFLSTAAVWSGSSKEVFDETVVAEPNTPYGFAKLASEALIVDAVTQGKIRSATILRCNNTYGPGSSQGVIASFYQNLKSGQPLVVDGDGKQLREPLFITDLIDLLVCVSTRQVDGVHVYGISGPQALTVCEIAEKTAKMLGRELQIKYRPERSDRSRHLLVSTQKAQSELGWRPMTLFDEGLRRIICEEGAGYLEGN